jgi:hypothetical protein
MAKHRVHIEGVWVNGILLDPSYIEDDDKKCKCGARIPFSSKHCGPNCED